MTYVLDCRQVSVLHDELCTTVAFTDDPVEIKRYVMIQSAHTLDRQDLNLISDGLYLELDDQINSVYRGITRIIFGPEQLELKLTDKARKALNLDGDVILQLDPDIPGLTEAMEELSRIADTNRIEFIGE